MQFVFTLSVRRGVLLLAVALSGGSLSVRGAQTEAAEAPDELFGLRCIGCHVPPDPRFAVERAWLEQVHDTA